MKVAVLDWGIGGVPCAQGLRERCPSLDLVLLSDAGHRPYGLVPRASLAKRVAWLLARGGADLTLVACNAASSVLPDVDTERPTLGLVEFGLELALAAPQEPIGVLAGQRVTTDEIYARPLRLAGRRVRASSGQALSALVERGETTGPRVKEAVAQALEPLADAASVLLACTHYPALTATLSAAAPGKAWLDPIPAMVRATVERYGLVSIPGSGALEVFTTGDHQAMRLAAENAFGVRLP